MRTVWRMGTDDEELPDPDPEPEPTQAPEPPLFIEPRWPIALVLSLFIALTAVLRVVEPHRESVSPHWLVPAIEVALLGALIAADPGHVVGRATWLRPLSISLIAALVGIA